MTSTLLKAEFPQRLSATNLRAAAMFWDKHKYDTQRIAQVLNVTESAVYNSLAVLREQKLSEKDARHSLQNGRDAV